LAHGKVIKNGRKNRSANPFFRPFSSMAVPNRDKERQRALAVVHAIAAAMAA
jgi:hypothetical protein